MNKLRALMRSFWPKVAAKEGVKLGSEHDPIRRMLFASESLEEQAARISPEACTGPFKTIATAAALAAQGEQEEARTVLRSLVADPLPETRVLLWTWSALRELGEMPDAVAGGEVLGVVLEVPSANAYDTLAAYADGSARYLNFSGSAIIWDRPDAEIKALCQALLNAGAAAGVTAEPRTNLALPRQGGRATLLTRLGLFAIADPPREVVATGSALLMKLIERAEEEKARRSPE